MYSNTNLLFIALDKDIDKLLHFKHYIVYLGRLIKGFNIANKSSKSLFTLEQLKIEYKVSIIRENLMYFIQKNYPNYCEQAQSKLYYSFDEEVECAILKTFVYSVEIEKIEVAQREKKRKNNDINNDISIYDHTKKKLSYHEESTTNQQLTDSCKKTIDVNTYEVVSNVTIK